MSTFICASVSPKMLAKIDRRFTNRLDDLFVELFQNARRAGATQISVTTREVERVGPDFFQTEITVVDNGSGIEDFSTLLRLGDSGWDSNVSAREDAAGEGFFSLVHSGVEVTSLTHKATFTKDSFLGNVPVEVKDIAEPFAGTRLVFGRPEDIKAVEESARRIALYGHTPCSFNGVDVPQEDFLKDALNVKEVNGVRIGVYSTYAHVGWNFHGRVLHRSISVLDDVMIDARGETETLHVRFDVLETQSIWLRLPDRSDVVEDEKFHALMIEAKRAMYEYLATLPSHCASFAKYTEAHSLGVDLAEAAPWFKRFTVDTSESDASSDVLPTDRKLHLTEFATSAIVDCMTDDVEYFAFTFGVAVEYFEKLDTLLLSDDPWRYKGYSWYQDMRRLHSFSLTIDGVEANEAVASAELTIVDAIKLSFSLTGQDESITWALPFACWANDDYSDQLMMFVTRSSPWASKSATEPFSLVDAAFHVAFSFNDSGDSDSFDTQQEYFYEEFSRNFLTVLGGEKAVIESEIAKALQSWPLSSLLKSEGIHHINLTSRPDGHGWSVALLEAA